MEDAEHHQALAIETILKDVGRVEYLQHELAVFHATCDRSAQARKAERTLCLADNLLRYGLGKIRVLLREKCGEALKIAERVLRPLDVYCSAMA